MFYIPFYVDKEDWELEGEGKLQQIFDGVAIYRGKGGLNLFKDVYECHRTGQKGEGLLK